MNRGPYIIPIVEGAGEREAVPLLLRRLIHEVLERPELTIAQSIVTNGKGNMDRRLAKYLRYARIQKANGIIILRDADDDCPHTIASNMADQVREVTLGVPVVIVCPKPEFEAWFIGSLLCSHGDAIRDYLELLSTIVVPDDVERLGDAKGWLSRHMPDGKMYKPTRHQAKLSARICVSQAAITCRSFRRLRHAVEELVDAMDMQTTNKVTP